MKKSLTEHGTLLWFIAAIVVPFLFLLSLRLQLPPLGESSNDVFWHVAAANRPLNEMVARKFPMTCSVWRDTFADKELFFHLLLKIYTAGKEICSSSLVPPFHLPWCLFALLFFAAYVLTARELKIPPPMIFLSSVLLAVHEAIFCFRILMLRPQILSMSLMLFSYLLLLKGPEKRKCVIGMFFLSFLYAWSYSTPHLVLIPGIVFGAVFFRETRGKSLFSLLASIVGLAAGYTLHPQFPNTFRIWKIQAVDALLSPITAGSGKIPYAAELLPPVLMQVVWCIPGLILLYFAVMLFIRTHEKRIPLPRPVTALFLLALLWTAALLTVSIRPAEYAFPLIVLILTVLLKHGAENHLFQFCGSRKRCMVFLLFAILLTAPFSWSYVREKFHTPVNTAPLRFFAKVRTLVPPGSRIVNVIWSDFPPCIFAAGEYEYTWGLDPMFSYAFDRDRTLYLSRAAFRKHRIDSRITGQAFRAEYAVVLGRQFGISDFLKECGWQVLCTSGDSTLFRIGRSVSAPVPFQYRTYRNSR